MAPFSPAISPRIFFNHICRFHDHSQGSVATNACADAVKHEAGGSNVPELLRCSRRNDHEITWPDRTQPDAGRGHLLDRATASILSEEEARE